VRNAVLPQVLAFVPSEAGENAGVPADLLHQIHVESIAGVKRKV